MDRRSFVVNSALSAAGVMMAGAWAPKQVPGSKDPGYITNIMDEVMSYRKINAHAHVDLVVGGPDTHIEFADRLGIEKMVVSRPITGSDGSPEVFRRHNDRVMEAMRRYPDRIIGQMTLNAAHQEESLEEIERCVDHGMVGLKVYRQVKINDPLFYPIIERFIDLDMIILMHSGPGINRIGPKYDTLRPPSLSIPEDFVDVAERYPEAMFQFAHTGGGLDWEYACKALRDSPNVYVDVSGSNNEENMINFALKSLGVDRLLFGCDLNYYTGVGHMFSADLTDDQRKKIFFDNYSSILSRGGVDVS